MDHNWPLMRIHKATIADGMPTTTPTIATMAAVGRVIAVRIFLLSADGEATNSVNQSCHCLRRLTVLQSARSPSGPCRSDVFDPSHKRR